MKLLRYGTPGTKSPACSTQDGTMRDLSEVIDDIGPTRCSPRGLKSSRARPDVAAARRRQPAPAACRTRGIGKFVCHRPELRRPRGGSRAAGADGADHLHEVHDVHLRPERRCDAAARTRRSSTGRSSSASSSAARRDTSRGRGAQPRRRLLRRQRRLRARVPDRAHGTWDKGKGCDTFGPIGPWVVTNDEVADPQALACGSR